MKLDYKSCEQQWYNLQARKTILRTNKYERSSFKE